MTAIGVSYRLFTMFMLAPEGGPAAGRPVLWLGMTACLLLVSALVLNLMASLVFGYVLAVAIALTLTVVAVYIRDVALIYRARRRKVLELNTTASSVALGFLLAGVAVLVVAFLFSEPARLVASAFHLLVFGWLSGLGLGQLYKIVPFLTWLECYGPVMGKRPVPRSGSCERGQGAHLVLDVFRRRWQRALFASPSVLQACSGWPALIRCWRLLDSSSSTSRLVGLRAPIRRYGCLPGRSGPISLFQHFNEETSNDTIRRTRRPANPA
ncbi:hypothetical protein LP421_08285 [Rhizobium sp. RCAM05350]|nr:hypothetical protein LP421_08285 [Rhizobium sp. RCAM05350]